MRAAALALAALIPCGFAGAAHPSLQALIDAAEPNATLVLEPGTYAGPAVLDKPLTLDGQGRATIDAGGTGTVATCPSVPHSQATSLATTSRRPCGSRARSTT